MIKNAIPLGRSSINVCIKELNLKPKTNKAKITNLQFKFRS